MNNYSTNYDRKKHIIFILIVSLFIAFLFDYLIYNRFIETYLVTLKSNYPEFHSILSLINWLFKISYLLIFYLFWNFYDKILWKKNLFKFMGKNKIPDISGDWEGYLISSRLDKCNQSVKRNVKFKIYQNFSEMKVTCYCYNDNFEVVTSVSDSDLIGLFFDEASITLKFSYISKSKEVSTIAKNYFGYNEFKINYNQSEMEGFYFTGRDSGQNNGIMSLKKI